MPLPLQPPLPTPVAPDDAAEYDRPRQFGELAGPREIAQFQRQSGASNNIAYPKPTGIG